MALVTVMLRFDALREQPGLLYLCIDDLTVFQHVFILQRSGKSFHHMQDLRG